MCRPGQSRVRMSLDTMFRSGLGSAWEKKKTFRFHADVYSYTENREENERDRLPSRRSYPLTAKNRSGRVDVESITTRRKREKPELAELTEQRNRIYAAIKNASRSSRGGSRDSTGCRRNDNGVSRISRFNRRFRERKKKPTSLFI